MIYYQDNELVIRSLEEADGPVFVEELTAQGWHPDIADFQVRMKDEAEGKSISLTAVYQGHPAGYVYLYKDVHGGPFKGKGWPMIVDFSVLEKYRRKGIGSRLMDAAEKAAAQYSDTVCLGVGLCDSYGSAQRMYVKRGYIPDGTGAWYHDVQCVQYETVCTVDDDLVLFLYKKLPGARPGRNGGKKQETAGAAEQAAAGDAETAAALALELWPEHTPKEMIKEFEALLADDEAAVFLYRKDGGTVGFAQCQLRHDYVEGTETSPVGYLEGIYVKEADRGQGIARKLLAACEDWARAKGCTEFASDCELTNIESQGFHRAVGFEEANRLVAYTRKL